MELETGPERVLRALQRQWFIVGVVLAITLAYSYPPLGVKGGPLRPEITVKYFVVSLIFFTSGLSLRFAELRAQLTRLRLYAAVQLFSLVAVPLAMYTLVYLLPEGLLSPSVEQGMLVLSCMPPPVSSAVILTKASGGNEAGAILNSTLGSFLGIVFTPLLLLLLLGSSSSAPLGGIVASLTTTVVLPLAAGQAVRARFEQQLLQANLPLGKLSNVALLVIIYTTFCTTFSTPLHVTSATLLTTVALLVLFHCACLLATFHLARGSFSPRDVVVVMFCGSHKSLTLGIPMLGIVFHGHPHLSALSIPLLIYHPMQIVLGSVLAPAMLAWVRSTHATK